MKLRFPLALALLCSACQDSAPGPAPVIAGPQPKKSSAPPAPKAGTLTAISINDLFPRQQSGNLLIYDVRPSFVTSFGTIPGAISWPRSDFNSRLPVSETEIRKARQSGKPTVIFCTDIDCPDARAVAEKLTSRGHDVTIFEGGYAEWKAAGLPTQ